MKPFTTNLQIPVTGAQLMDLLDLHKKDILLSLFCHGVATVTAFDPATQTASATMNYKKTFTVRQADGTYTAELRDYPLLANCPVIFLGGANSYLTFPDIVGSECQVIFNDRDLENWLTNSGQRLASSRLHSFSDAIILVGLRSAQNAISSFDVDRILLKKGNAKIGVGKDNELLLLANATYTLNQLLQELITEIKNITVGPGTFSNSGGPVTGASGTPLNASSITTTANKIAQLLE